MAFTLTRSLMTIVIPGGVVLAPWIVFVVLRYPDIADVYKDYEVATTAGLAGLLIVVGTIIEVLASFIEDLFDKTADAKMNVRENWFNYLAHKRDADLIGFGYISRRVTTMYFELCMGLAVPFSAFGIAALMTRHFEACALPTIMVTGGIVGFLLAVLFIWAGKRTHHLLCEVRQELNTRLVPKAPGATP
jgi:hypothetical protein